MMKKKISKILSGVLAAAIVAGNLSVPVSAAEIFQDGPTILTEQEGPAEENPMEEEIVSEAEEADFSSGMEDAYSPFETKTPEIEEPEDILPGEATTSGTVKGTKVKWKYDAGVLTLSGSGAVPDYIVYYDPSLGKKVEENPAPWKHLIQKVTEIKVEKGVTGLGQSIFSDCKALTKVTVASSVKKIGSYCFDQCFSLREINLTDGLEELGERAFNASPLESITLPSTIKMINAGSLWGMLNLEKVMVKGKSTSCKIINDAIYLNNGTELACFPFYKRETCEIAGGTKKILPFVFRYSNLKEITIPDSVTSIGRYAFYNSENLEKIIFSKNVKVIPENICGWCIKLESVTIPEGIEEVDKRAFEGCSALKSVSVPSTMKKISDTAFPVTTKVIITKKGPNFHEMENGQILSVVPVNVRAVNDYTKAFEVLNLVNKERKKAGVPALTMEPQLLNIAMLRASELVLYYSHTRPSKIDCFTAHKSMNGENIAGGTACPPEFIMMMWMNSEMHKANILNKNFKTIGIGCVEINGENFWAQCFSGEKGTIAKPSSYKKKTITRKVWVDPDSSAYCPEFKLTKTSFNVGEKVGVKVVWDEIPLSSTGVKIVSSNSSVCRVVDGALQGVKPGKAKISMYYGNDKAYAVTKTVTIKGTVHKVTSISLQRRTLKLTQGKSYTLKATVKPSNATNKSLTWTSSNTKVATVKDGKVTAKAPGTATITAKAKDGSNKRITCKVTVVK